MINLNNISIKSAEYKVKREIDKTVWTKINIHSADIAIHITEKWRQSGVMVLQQIFENTNDKIKPN